jgi:hypothetical protein
MLNIAVWRVLKRVAARISRTELEIGLGLKSVANYVTSSTREILCRCRSVVVVIKFVTKEGCTVYCYFQGPKENCVIVVLLTAGRAFL